MSEPPVLSVILATDAFSTIEPVVRRLRAQSVAGKLELVIVTPHPDALRQEAADLAELVVVVVGVDGLVPLAAARAAGVRAANAPVVFVGETHTYPEEGWAKALIDAHAGDWAAVVPGFGNANPSGALSWAGFLTDYGSWLGSLEAREVSRVPAYNTAYKRAELLEFGGRLDLLLSTSDELIVELRAAGRRFVFQPRLLYAAGSPLIPAVVLARVARGVAAARRAHGLPLAVYPALLLGAVLSAIGELVAYVGGPVAWAERRMTEYELHRLRYLRA